MNFVNSTLKTKIIKITSEEKCIIVKLFGCVQLEDVLFKYLITLFVYRHTIILNILLELKFN